MTHPAHRPLTPLALAALLTAALPGLAQAQSTVKLYGLLDLSVGSFQNAGAAKVKRVESGNLSTSYLGFSGTEDLGGGLKALFALETFLRADTGMAGRVAVDVPPRTDVYWARAANVGLSGAFGTAKLGRNTTPMFVSTLIFNPFGDSFGYAPSIRQYYTSALLGDSGWSNSLRYDTPRFGGFSATVMGSLAENGGKSVGHNLGANALYFAGPFAATLAWQQVKSDTDLRFSTTLPAGFVDQTALQLGASFDFGAAKLFAQVGQVETDAAADTKAKLSQLGVSVPVGMGKLLASYGQLKYSGAKVGSSKTLSLGYDHNLSKRTDVYAVYTNDKYTGLATGNSYSVGVRHTF